MAVTARWLPESTRVNWAPSKRSAMPSTTGGLVTPTRYRLSMLEPHMPLTMSGETPPGASIGSRSAVFQYTP